MDADYAQHFLDCSPVIRASALQMVRASKSADEIIAFIDKETETGLVASTDWWSGGGMIKHVMSYAGYDLKDRVDIIDDTLSDMFAGLEHDAELALKESRDSDFREHGTYRVINGRVA
jgi:hypothetical protein